MGQPDPHDETDDRDDLADFDEGPRTIRATASRTIPPAVIEKLFAMAREGRHRTRTIIESLGYTSQALSRKRAKDREFDRQLRMAEAEGRIKLANLLLDTAVDVKAWQAMQRRLEVVYGELHPVDEAKVDTLRRADDPGFLRELAQSIMAAFGTLPVQFERPPLDQPDAPKPDEEPAPEADEGQEP